MNRPSVPAAGVLELMQQKLELEAENASLKAELAELKAAQEWRSIETAPKDGKAWYWIVPKTAEEAPRDTQGNPIMVLREPFMAICSWKGWPASGKPVCWLPLPNPPKGNKDA